MKTSTRSLARVWRFLLGLGLFAIAAAAVPAWAASGPSGMSIYYSLSVEQLIRSGRLEQAVDPARRWLRLSIEEGDTLQSARAHEALASIFGHLQQPDSARAHALLAISLANTIPGGEESPAAALALAEVAFEAGREDSANACFRHAQELAAASRDSFTVGEALLHIGRRSLAAGSAQLALAQLDSSEVQLHGSSESSSHYLVHRFRGRSLARLGRLRDARAEFEAAYPSLLQEYRSLFSEGGQISLMEESRSFFDEWQELWLADRSLEPHLVSLATLAIAERSRAQVLLEARQPSKIFAPKDSFELQLIQNPARHFAPGSDLVAEARAVLGHSVPPGAALLYYSQLPESLVVWIFRDGHDARFSMRFPERLPDRVAALAVPLSDPSMIPQELSGWLGRLKARFKGENPLGLFSRLCFPDTLLGMVKGATEVVIIPDGWMNQVAFAALPVGADHRPLGLIHALRYAPSLAVLADLEEREHKVSTQLGPEDVLVIGDPFENLPAAREEADSVAGFFDVQPLIGPAATESVLVSRWSHLRLIHLATHGRAYASVDSALESYVRLARNRGMDGRLTAGQIATVLPASHLELVFLSACETALGSNWHSEGVIGLPRALLANGAQSVIASMWKARDKSAALLATQFYRHLLGDIDRPVKSEALRRAMIETSRVWPDPVCWAEFKLYGSQ